MTAVPTFEHLDPLVSSHMVRTLLPTLPWGLVPTEAARDNLLNAALCFLGVLDPRTPTEALLAVNVTATLFAGLEAHRRALQSDADARTAARLHRSAVSMHRVMSDAMRTMMEARRHSAPPPAPAPAEGPLPQPARPRLRVVGGRDA